jgi:glutamine amidotransferase
MIAIVDYGMGNVASVKNALNFLGAEAAVTSNPADFEQATHIILPGVGAFGDGMRNLRERGLIPVLSREALERKKPFIGICLGMELLADIGEEGGENIGLGWIAGRVRHLRIDEKELRLPHIGWNDVTPRPTARLFAGVVSPVFYFVHSFVLEPDDDAITVATCEYGETFVAGVERENIFGTQFHPEKSQKSGLAVLRNFLDL